MSRRGRDDQPGRLSVRVLVVALIVQLALGAGIIFAAVNGFPLIGGGAQDAARQDERSAALPAVPRARVDRFDVRRAFRTIRMQLKVGQRPAGSPQLQALAGKLRAMLPEGSFEDVPGSDPAHQLRNVVGLIHGRRPPIVIGAHYDSEAHPPGFVGANDSAAGTAGVIEIARALSRMKRPPGHRAIRFVLFDGEEEPLGCPSEEFASCALRGSKADAAGPGAHTRAMILLDYVANKGLRLPREPTSNKDLWGRLRDAADTVGVGKAFPPGQQRYAILDDHTPYLKAGIPAVDLIDFSYRYKDTVRDTLDKLDPRSLDAVGESVIELVRQLDRSGY